MSFYSNPVFFYAFNNSAQTVSQGQYFTVSNYENVGAGTSGRVDLPHKAFVYGEIQTTVSAANNNYDVRITNNTLLTCKGFQCRNNTRVGAMDDGAYALVNAVQTGIIFNQRYGSGSETSDANQTRIYGVYSS